MVRFQNRKKSRKNRRVFLSICVFLVILLLFISGIDSFSDSTRRSSERKPGAGIKPQHRLLLCNGRHYPESLEDLKAHMV
mgnify:CR=1 FL=1